MKSFTTLTSLFTTLSQNVSTSNTTLGGILINDQHRYLIQKYFDNEKTTTITTIGPTTLSLTATTSVGSTSATLATAWQYPTCSQLVVFNDGEQRMVYFTQNSTAITWTSALAGEQFTTTAVIPAGATSATLVNAWPTASQSSTASFSDGTTKTITFTQNSTNISWTGGLAEQVSAFVNVIPTSISISCVGVQSYNLGANVSKIKNSTITIGQLVYTPAPVQSIQEWTKLNALPYTSNIPGYFFVYDNKINFWPIPSSTGNIVTIYCQINVADMTYSDTTGTLANSGAVSGSNSITGNGTTWASTYPQNVDLTAANLYLNIQPPGGDGLYYQIQSFQSNTTLTLVKPIVNAPNITTSTNFTIGQYPLLSGDFHDIIVYWALVIYFSTIVKDTDRYTQFNGILQNKLELMKGYLSTKQVNVDLSVSPTQRNANLFTFAPPTQ